jgi:hypothetical protein
MSKFGSDSDFEPDPKALPKWRGGENWREDEDESEDGGHAVYSDNVEAASNSPPKRKKAKTMHKETTKASAAGDGVTYYDVPRMEQWEFETWDDFHDALAEYSKRTCQEWR